MSINTKEKTSIILCDLPHDITEQDIKSFLSEYKDKIDSIDFQDNKYYIKFKDNQSAKQCRLNMDQKCIKNKTIRIVWEEKDFLQNNKDKKIFLYIKEIPNNKSAREIFEYFVKFGEIFSFKINDDNQGNNNRTAFVTYYNQDDAKKAIDETNGKKLWNSNIEVQYKKNSEKNYYTHDKNLKVNINNLPDDYSNKDLEKLCEEFGKMQIIKVNNNNRGKYAIVKFNSEAEAKKAIEKLNNKEIGEKKLHVKEAKDYPYNRNNFQQNNYYNFNCNLNIGKPMMKYEENKENTNLYIKYIPFTVTEDDLRKTFSKFGKITSIKLEVEVVETKAGENEEKKKITRNKGYGYLSFEKVEEAKNALEALNGKYLEGFESWSKALYIDFYETKEKRQQNFMVQAYNYIPNPNNFMQFPPGQIFPYQMMPMNMQLPNQYKMMKMNPKHYNNINIHQPHRGRGRYNKNHPKREKNEAKIEEKNEAKIEEKNEKTIKFDYENFEKCKTPEEKKDFLGEKIFNAIKENPKMEKKDENTVGLITGMILGIPNENEIIEILENPKAIDERINEALELINKDDSNKK